MTPPLIVRNASVLQAVDVIVDNYGVPPDLLEQFGKAFAGRVVEEAVDEVAADVADEVVERVKNVLRKVTPDLDDEAAKEIVTTVWAAVTVALERVEWRL